MATATLTCTEARRWNYQDATWYPFNGSSDGYSNLGAVGWIPQVTGFTPGIQMYSFGAVPAGAVISSATLKIKTHQYAGSSTSNCRLRISSTYEAYTTTAPIGYQQTSVSFSPTLTERTIDITSQMQSYATAGASVYLYFYEPSSEFIGAATQDTQGIAGSTPVIEITYTLGGDTVGRYNGSTFENCEVFRYNGTTFVQCDIFRYDGTQFVECSTT